MASTRNALHPSDAGATSALPSSPHTVLCDSCKKPCVDMPSLCGLSLAEPAISSSLLEDTSPCHPQALEKNAHAGHFDCSICLNECYEPVVTLCGHLFCWPCLYCWLSLHAVSQKCPVCKASVGHGKIVPVYGGSGVERPMHSADRMFSGIKVPSRPGCDTLNSSASGQDNDERNHEIDQQYEMSGMVLTWGSRHVALSAHVGFFCIAAKTEHLLVTTYQRRLLA